MTVKSVKCNSEKESTLLQITYIRFIIIAMKKLIYISLLFFIITVSVFSSCKEKKTYCEENPGECRSVLTAKQFFLFKIGSWWVYEEETSLERDSVYVTEYTNSSGYDFDMRTYSTLEDYVYHYSPFFAGGNQSCSESAPVQGKCLYINRSKGKSGDYVGQGYCFFVNYRKGDDAFITGNIYFENNKIIVSNVLSTYNIGTLNFGETVIIHELSTRIEGIQPTNHYFAKNVGLIRKELLDSNQVWNLVSYHIEP